MSEALFVTRRCALKMFSFVLLSGCADVSDSGDRRIDAEKNGAQGPDVSGAPEEQSSAPTALARLGNDQIAARLAGHTIMPDRQVNQHSFEFAEEFLPDGSWRIRRTERVLTTKTGTWRVVEGAVCVATSNAEPICRSVWVDAEGRIAMRDMFSPLGTILIMSVTQLR